MTPTPEIIEVFLKNIEISGNGEFTSYNLENEVELINKKISKLSAGQRKLVLDLTKRLKES